MDVEPSDGNDGLRNLKTLVTSESFKSLPVDRKTPLVLVPGFSGWGEALLGTINYWGGFEDLPKALQGMGYTVIAVKPGPISSNIERAYEIFTQLSNIGNNTGFDLPGGTPTPITPCPYPPDHPSPDKAALQSAWTWSAVVFGNLPAAWKWDSHHPVHFVCHSQGGTTIRCLVELLSGRQSAHRSLFPPPGRQGWVRSVVTLGTPHKGTTVTDVVKKLLPSNYLDIMTRLIVSASFKTRGSRFYDLQLDHWGFSRQGGESFLVMHARVAPYVRRWWESNYHGFHDNSIDGITDLDKLAGGPSPDIYYFTMSFSATVPFPRRTLSAQDVNSFFDLFPLHEFANPFDIFGGPIAFLHIFFAEILRIFPPLATIARWFTGVLNRHLGEMGYFSQIPEPGSQVPRPDMLPIIAATGYAMGGYELSPKALTDLSATNSTEYQENDGIVNTLSMSGPRNGPIQSTDGFRAALDQGKGKGIYWHFGRNLTMDHADQIGVFTDPSTFDEVKLMYKLIAELVTRLPP